MTVSGVFSLLYGHMQVPSANAMCQLPLTLEPGATILEAIQRLSQSQVGCVLVLEQQQLVGLCTEQDCLRAIATGVDPETTTIADFMTRSPITLRDSEALSTAWQVMQHHRLQHLPVVDQTGQVLGVLTERSLLQAVDPDIWLEAPTQPLPSGSSAYEREGIDRRRFYDQLQLRAQREEALNRVIQAIRNSLDLDTVFGTATAEIAQLLQADRADIIQYLPARPVWKVVSDSHYQVRLTSIAGMEFADDANQPISQLKQLEVVQLEDVAQHPDATVSQYAQFLPGTWLLVPLHFEAKLWGCLALIRDHQQPWQEAEVELARAVVDQLSIAIQQSQLYQQVRQLNETLENQVQERTAQLRKALDYEALLKRITDRVRDSLDERHILQTTVQELAAELDVLCCDTGLYDPECSTITICYEAIRSDNFATAKGAVISLETLSTIGEQTLQGQWIQFCSLSSPLDAFRAVSHRFTILSCPLIDNQGILGDMWLFRPCDQCFDDSEIRLVQQVANQCAIALRQSRLYQEIQAQVSNLEQLNYLKDDFLSSVSHELRTPMANIKMATQMLEILFKQMGVFNHESSRISQYFKVLQDECQREINLINNLLDLSRVESGDDPLTLTTKDLQSWIPGIANVFVDRAKSQQQTLLVEVPSRLPPLTTDFSYLERILTELLHNAFKYTPPGETVGVFTITTSNHLQIHVRNTGVELGKNELDRIFDKFYRIPNSDPWKHGGTGLGLALVKRLTEHLGASIHAESENGQTTFIITFPTEPM
ncbi:GAF domain-containing protein [Stenomitos frigidus]|uniref:histidine kinase n=1 Tax=Stenomitos frigidus ULC18 TaxID=2107698 RepID=A0A2T1DWN9_9CYAN|nr:GAF domain-containing protein [Stenomitos frigidus]PSB24900.1 ATPase [Stenomitos frigidus ULC18]